MKILVTGASGFVGSHVVDHALSAGHEVYAAVRRSSSLQWLTDPRVHVIMLDDVPGSGIVFDAVVWCAGITKALHADDFEKVNNLSMQRFVGELRTNGCLPRVFVYMSSLSARTPHSVYGQSKLHAAEWLRDQKGFARVILYPTGVYGPRDKDYLQQFQIVGSGFDFVPGLTGEQTLTFVYVEDLADVVLRCLDIACNQPEGAETIEMDVTEPASYTNSEFRQLLQSEFVRCNGKRHHRVFVLRVPVWLLTLICSVSGMIARWRGKPALLNADKARILAQKDWSADTSQMQRWIGVLPRTTLAEGIGKTFAWYRQQGWIDC